MTRSSRSRTVHVKVSDAERAILREAAAAEGLSLNAYLRREGMRAAAKALHACRVVNGATRIRIVEADL